MTAGPADDTAGLPAAPEVVQIEVGLLQNFCEILYCPETRVAAIVDPAWEVDRLLREVERLGLKVELALITHTHNDHIEGVGELVREDGRDGGRQPARGRRACAARAHARRRGRRRATLRSAGAACARWRRAATPWAAPATSPTARIVTGDVLFVGGCGRTDFPGGDTAEMWQSLQRLMRLPEETRVYPGHNYGETADVDDRPRGAQQSVPALRDVRGLPRPARAQAESLRP